MRSAGTRLRHLPPVRFSIHLKLPPSKSAARGGPNGMGRGTAARSSTRPRARCWTGNGSSRLPAPRGHLWVCPVCAGARDIDASDLFKGAEIAGGVGPLASSTTALKRSLRYRKKVRLYRSGRKQNAVRRPQGPSDNRFWFVLNSSFAGDESVAKHFKDTGVGFAPGTVKSIDRFPDLEIHETTTLNQLLPACTRQASGDSRSPQINITHHRFRYRFAIGDVGKLQNATRPEDA
jgi:hypothetical protein